MSVRTVENWRTILRTKSKHELARHVMSDLTGYPNHATDYVHSRDTEQLVNLFEAIATEVMMEAKYRELMTRHADLLAEVPT